MSGRIARLASLILGLFILGFAIQSSKAFLVDRSKTEDELLWNSRRSVLRMAMDINNSVTQIVDAARSVSSSLSGRELSCAEIQQSLMDEAKVPEKLQAIGVVALDGGQCSQPVYVRNAQGIFEMKYLSMAPSEDVDTWQQGFKDLEDTWSEPIRDIYKGNLQVVYVFPYTRFDPEKLRDVKAGYVFATLALEDIGEVVKSLDLGDEGYAYIVSGRCTYLVNPNMSLINTKIDPATDKCQPVASAARNPFSVTSVGSGLAGVLPVSKSMKLPGTGGLVYNTLPGYNQNDLEGYIDLALKGTLKFYTGLIGGRSGLYFFEPIPAAGWSMGVVLQKDPHNSLVEKKKNNDVKTALLIAVSLILIAVFVFNLRVESERSMWSVSIAATLLLVSVIVLIWVLEIANPSNPTSSTLLSSHAVLSNTLEEVDQRFIKESAVPPTRIPTGIFIESFAVDGRDITLTGYIWQKYPKDIVSGMGDDELPQVVFTDSQSQEMELAYRFDEDGYEVLGYYFRVSQMQTFASREFPLDLATVSLQLQADDLSKNYLLIPDLDSYNRTNPSERPGIKDGLVLNNWNIFSSSFTYKDESRDMDFGGKQIKQYSLPVLQFDVSLKRFIVPSLLSYGITAMVTAILMFSLVVSQAENLRSVLTESFALFFVLVVAHVGLRGELASQSIVYLETLFIILYCLILLGVLNGLLQFVEFKIPLFSYQDGLLFKLFYWPVLFGVFLLVSLVTFYPNLFGK